MTKYKPRWIRPEFQGREDELETQEQSAQRTGETLSSLRSYVRRYPSAQPGEEPLPGEITYPLEALREGRLAYRVAKEIDEFLATVQEREAARTPGQVADAEVRRITLALGQADARCERLRAQLADADRERARLAKALRMEEERATLLNKRPG